MSEIISVQYDNGFAVPFNTEAWINATAVAKQFNKLPKDYLKTSRTKEYIEAVRRILLTNENQLVTVIQGGDAKEQGTWFHPKLAIDFARWLSADFAVWCDLQIEKILHGKQPAPQAPTPQTSPAVYTRQSITENMRLHLKHHVSTLLRESNRTPQGIWGTFCKHFGISSYQYLPIEQYPTACAYFEIEPIFKPEHTNAFVYIAKTELDALQSRTVLPANYVAIHIEELAVLRASAKTPPDLQEKILAAILDAQGVQRVADNQTIIDKQRLGELEFIAKHAAMVA